VPGWVPTHVLSLLTEELASSPKSKLSEQILGVIGGILKYERPAAPEGKTALVAIAKTFNSLEGPAKEEAVEVFEIIAVEYPDLSQEAVAAIGRSLNDEPSASKAVSSLETLNSDKQNRRIDVRPVMPFLRTLVVSLPGDTSEAVTRENAVRLLAKIDSPNEAAKTLATAYVKLASKANYRLEYGFVVERTAEAIGELPAEVAVPTLVKLLNLKDVSILRLIQEVRKIGPAARDALPALYHYLSTLGGEFGDDLARDETKSAIASIEGRSK
jgi:hypothetical protein